MNEEPQDIDELLERADSLEERGSPAEAMRLLRRALEIARDAVILTRIGSLATDLEQWREAETALLEAIDLEPDFAPAHFYLALLYREQGRLEAALARMKSACRLEESASNLTVLGVVQLELGFTAEAQESFRRALKIDAEYEEALYNLATTLTGNLDGGAIELFTKAIEIDSSYALAHRELGWLLRRKNEYCEAEYHLRRAIELDSSDGWSYIYLGNLMWAIGDEAGAEGSFQEAIRVWPDRSIPYWCLAHFRELQGNKHEAETLYSKALEMDPGDAQANWRFGSYLAEFGNIETAKRYLKWATELDPADKRASGLLSTLETNLPKP